MSTFLDKLKQKKLLTNGDTETANEAYPSSQEAKSSQIAVPLEQKLPSGTLPLQIDLFQKESCFILYAALPAVSAADLEVVLDGDGDVLIIKATQKDPRSVPAEKKTDSKEKESMLAKMIKPAATSPKAEKTLFQEVIWRKYYRRVSLPAQISSHEIKAELSEGVLKVTLPMLKSSYKKIIEVSEKVS